MMIINLSKNSVLFMVKLKKIIRDSDTDFLCIKTVENDLLNMVFLK